MTSTIFRVPFVKQIATICGSSPITKSLFRQYCQQGNTNIMFCPGGVQEVIYKESSSSHNDIVLYLKKRKGFIKLALEHGCPIVPAFIFYLDSCFYSKLISFPSWIPKIARKVGYLPCLFAGRWCIPFGIPYPQKLHVVVGNLIDVAPIITNEGEKKMDQDLIDHYHELYIKELVKLFEKYKGSQEGYHEKVLKII